MDKEAYAPFLLSLTPEEKSLLLKLARNTIRAAVTTKPKEIELSAGEGEGGVSVPDFVFISPRLGEKAGAFVSLHCYGELRGCMGTLAADESIKEVVEKMALAAAFDDPRFPPLTEEKLADLDIEISLLSSLVQVSPDEVLPGKHGLCLIRGSYRGVLLPQVATMYGWDRETFLNQTCIKAGLPEDAWHDPETTILVFTAEVFAEGEVRIQYSACLWLQPL